MRKTAVIVLSVILILFSFNERELYKKDIRNRLVIQGVGIDAEKDGTYTVTLQAINTAAQSSPAGEGGPQTPVKTYTLKGETVYSAIKSAAEYDGKIPLSSQNRVIIIGRETAEKGIEGIVDYFVRDVENSASLRIAVADGRASEIMEASPENGEVIARNIEQSIRSSEYQPEISELQLYKLADRYRSSFGSYSAPVIALKENGGEKEKTVEIKETALFSGARLKSTLTKDETVMLNFLCNTSYNGAASYKTAKDEKISVSIIDSKTKRLVKMENGKPVFNINVNIECDIAEIYNGILKSIDEKRISELEGAAEKYFKGEIENIINKLYREAECDVPAFSRLIYIRYPSFYRKQEKNLNTVMAESRYNVEVKVTVRRVGHEFVEL